MNVSEMTKNEVNMKYGGTRESETKGMKDRITRIVSQSLIDEVMVTPKPGLVDTRDNGAHTDMNVDTFVVSAAAIAPYIADMFLCGWEWEKEVDRLFSAIIPLGMQAEKAMFRATKGVNTHKGAIFTMGILSAAAGYSQSHRSEMRDCCGENEPVQHILSILTLSGEMMQKPMEKAFREMQKKVPETHGEKLFSRYGEKGIRGEAELGFPIIKTVALPLFFSYMNQYRPSGEILDDPVQNSININVLLQIMSKLSDTCVLSRGDRESLLWLQEKAAEVYDLGGAFTDAGTEAIVRWNRECIKKNISPGGAADILAVTLFLWRVESESIV